jgi:hypothetical protein
MGDLISFDLLENLVDSRNRENNDDIPIKILDKNPHWNCQHENTQQDVNGKICLDCGQEIFNEKYCEKDYKFFDDGKTLGRCQIKREYVRSIYNDLDGKDIPEKVGIIADKLYSEITKGGIRKKTNRTSIIFGCVYEAYKQYGNPVEFDKLISIFNINRKSASKGIKFVNFQMPKELYSDHSYTNISIKTLIKNIMDLFESKDVYVNQVIEIYEKIKNKSRVLNGCWLQSLSAGLVYYWIKINDKAISLKDYAIRVNLSEITIKKMITEIEKVLKSS